MPASAFASAFISAHCLLPAYHPFCVDRRAEVAGRAFLLPTFVTYGAWAHVKCAPTPLPLPLPLPLPILLLPTAYSITAAYETHRRKTHRRASLLLIPRLVMPFQPVCQSVEPGKQNAFGDVRLVEFIPDFPFEIFGNDEPAVEGRV